MEVNSGSSRASQKWMNALMNRSASDVVDRSDDLPRGHSNVSIHPNPLAVVLPEPGLTGGGGGNVGGREWKIAALKSALKRKIPLVDRCSLVQQGLCHMCGNNNHTLVINLCPHFDFGHSVCLTHFEGLTSLSLAQVLQGKVFPCPVCTYACTCAICDALVGAQVDMYDKWTVDKSIVLRNGADPPPPAALAAISLAMAPRASVRTMNMPTSNSAAADAKEANAASSTSTAAPKMAAKSVARKPVYAKKRTPADDGAPSTTVPLDPMLRAESKDGASAEGFSLGLPAAASFAGMVHARQPSQSDPKFTQSDLAAPPKVAPPPLQPVMSFKETASKAALLVKPKEAAKSLRASLEDARATAVVDPPAEPKAAPTAPKVSFKATDADVKLPPLSSEEVKPTILVAKGLPTETNAPSSPARLPPLSAALVATPPKQASKTIPTETVAASTEQAAKDVGLSDAKETATEATSTANAVAKEAIDAEPSTSATTDAAVDSDTKVTPVTTETKDSPSETKDSPVAESMPKEPSPVKSPAKSHAKALVALPAKESPKLVAKALPKESSSAPATPEKKKKEVAYSASPSKVIELFSTSGDTNEVSTSAVSPKKTSPQEKATVVSPPTQALPAPQVATKKTASTGELSQPKVPSKQPISHGKSKQETKMESDERIKAALVISLKSNQKKHVPIVAPETTEKCAATPTLSSAQAVSSPSKESTTPLGKSKEETTKETNQMKDVPMVAPATTENGAATPTPSLAQAVSSPSKESTSPLEKSKEEATKETNQTNDVPMVAPATTEKGAATPTPSSVQAVSSPSKEPATLLGKSKEEAKKESDERMKTALVISLKSKQTKGATVKAPKNPPMELKPTPRDKTEDVASSSPAKADATQKATTDKNDATTPSCSIAPATKDDDSKAKPDAVNMQDEAGATATPPSKDFATADALPAKDVSLNALDVSKEAKQEATKPIDATVTSSSKPTDEVASVGKKGKAKAKAIHVVTTVEINEGDDDDEPRKGGRAAKGGPKGAQKSSKADDDKTSKKTTKKLGDDVEPSKKKEAKRGRVKQVQADESDGALSEAESPRESKKAASSGGGREKKPRTAAPPPGALINKHKPGKGAKRMAEPAASGGGKRSKVSVETKDTPEKRGRGKRAADATLPKAGKRGRSEPESTVEDETAEKGEDEEVDTNLDYCSICLEDGDLVCCDICPRSFHLDCLKMTEDDLPDGDWQCAECESNQSEAHFDRVTRDLVMLRFKSHTMRHMLNGMMTHPFAKPFITPVEGVDGYDNVVKERMDFNTIKARLEAGKYAKDAPLDSEFVKDIRLIWYNCRLFNDENSGLARAAKTLATGFDAMVAKLSP
ncbi:Aste57867_21842 [Aphanomyces stellatus]|uniref:Aste57867_21842 protein n=1 Tax=Aphanomyces stellatus TaxID=120398 RepID=A0A485LIL5_9STRA|nr:hypothetical protein As57867_021773 [Aphanomyces stellatus]VFT98511.1 Aste57867_21842 [Aphanomyces stellatus]